MEFIEDATIVMLPAAVLIPYAAYIIAAIAAVAVVLLMPDAPEINPENQQAGSANNDLTNRRNKTRINQRFVDFVGENLSIPDVLQPEWSKYFDGKEERIGAYVFGRNTVDVKQLSDGESLIEDRAGASAGIYRPFTSPNNSAPFEQIGDPINEPIVGVYQSTDAVGQTLEAPEERKFFISNSATIAVDKPGEFAWIIDPTLVYSDYPVGLFIELADVFVLVPGEPTPPQVGNGELLEVTSNAFGRLEFSISGYSSWNQLPDDYVNYDIASQPNPKVISKDVFEGDTYKIKREKVDRLIFNVYGPNGIYKRATGNKQNVTVGFEVVYYRLDDNYSRIGAKLTATGEISGATDDSIGVSIDIDLINPTYVEWSIFRTTYEDTDFEGTVVDTIKLKSVFGLFDLGVSDFGNITMAQTKRRQLEQVTAIANPEVNATCTEMIYKYLGGGVFDTQLTTNTQAMQSLIAKALDPKIGRLTVDDLDLDMLLQTQVDNETYYQTDSAGKCSYSFDTLNTSAQEVFFLIANAASVILWREGRVLKSWFERPQTVPEMAFTHRSKVPGDETWNRDFTVDYDGVEFPYIDDKTNSQETLKHPTDATNPKKIDLKGFRGLEQATWRMLREYNKQQNQRITVDFTATAEGRFAKPAKLISVVKGTRVGQTGGYIINADLLTVELSQEVAFTPGDDHFLVLKTRNGGTQTVSVTETANPRIVQMDFAPIEPIYYGNDELKTEFSFGNEARLQGQLMLPQSIDASDQYSTKITAVNYSDAYYEGDATQPIGSAFSDGFSNGFS
ncbi:host specificity factor TipJ family phage tail protein [bacterium]|nr:host specificity factor TipJ family phage tail protein [bacterium]